MYGKIVMAVWCVNLLATFFVTNAGAMMARSRVHANAVAEATTPEGVTVYKVDYSFEFLDVRSVCIAGVGTVSPKGRFAYFTDNPRIEFRDSTSGDLLAALRPPRITESLGLVPLSLEEDFPHFAQYKLWEYPCSFQKIVMDVLNKRGFEYKPYERDEIYYIRTTYFSIEGIPKYLRAKIALLFSHPYDTADGSFKFKIQHKAIQRRLKEYEWNELLCDEVETLCNRFVRKLIDEVMQLGKARK